MHDKTNSGDLSRPTPQILFRGRPTYADIGSKTWVYGSLLTDKYGNDWIANQSIVDVGSKDLQNAFTPVLFVGQFTGLTDKNGKQIFEGDVVSYLWDHDPINFIIKFKDGEFLAFPIGFDVTDKESPSVWPIRISGYTNDFTIIGNIYDNPELLKGESE